MICTFVETNISVGTTGKQDDRSCAAGINGKAPGPIEHRSALCCMISLYTGHFSSNRQ